MVSFWVPRKLRNGASHQRAVTPPIASANSASTIIHFLFTASTPEAGSIGDWAGPLLPRQQRRPTAAVPVGSMRPWYTMRKP